MNQESSTLHDHAQINEEETRKHISHILWKVASLGTAVLSDLELKTIMLYACM